MMKFLANNCLHYKVCTSQASVDNILEVLHKLLTDIFLKNINITYRSISVVEEVVQYIEDGSLRQDQLLQVLRMEVVSVHVDSW